MKARRVRDLDAMHKFMPYILKKRCDSEAYILETVDVTEAMKYVKANNSKDNGYTMTLFHLIIAALAKTIVHRPYLNRYISGKRFYEREEVSFSFIIKKKFQDAGEESMMILRTGKEGTLEKISREIYSTINEVKQEGGNNLDGVLEFLVKLPRFLLIFVAFVLNAFEYFNVMPESLSHMDPYYTTVLLSNLGSIKVGASYHHLVEYGTNSIVITVGEVRWEDRAAEDGSSDRRAFIDLGVTIDERIADGFYFSQSTKLLRHLMGNPRLLEESFENQVQYD